MSTDGAAALPINRIQLQYGMPIPARFDSYGSEAQCALALKRLRWQVGFRCPRCCEAAHCMISHEGRQLFQCHACRRQTSLTAGTMMDSSKLPLRTWFLAMYLISQAKTGLSALALMRDLGVNYRTAWLMHQKIMGAMARSDAALGLGGDVQVDDAYLGGEHPGKVGRGSAQQSAFVAAVALSLKGHPLQVKMSPVPGFTLKAIADWARSNLTPGADVLSDGLSCFAGVIDAGCARSYFVVGQRKPRDMPQFHWVNTTLDNLKTAIAGAHKAFKFRKYTSRYLGAFSFRFNRSFDLHAMVSDLFAHAFRSPPERQREIRGLPELHT